MTTAATAAEPKALKEDDVLRIALKRSPALAVAAAQDRQAEALEHAGDHHPNPRATWTSEEDGRIKRVGATLPIDIGRAAAHHALDAAEAAGRRIDAAHTRRAGLIEALDAFHATAIAQRRLALRKEALQPLQEVAQVLAKREAAGHTAGYDRIRLDVATRLAKTRVLEAEGLLAASRHRLARHIGIPHQTLRVEDTLPLIPPDRATALLRSAGQKQPTLARARERARKARRAAKRSRWSWLPAFALSAAREEQEQRDPTTVLGVELDLPLVNGGGHLRRTAAAEQGLAEAELRRVEQQTAGELQEAAALLKGFRDALNRLQANDQLQALQTAARSGYSAGELGLLELLEAQRHATEVAERRLELLRAAKRAETLLRAAAGDMIP